MLKIYVFCFVLVIALTLAGCGSSSSTPNPGAHVTVTISPTSAPLTAGATQQFAATVQGSSNTAVTWSVDNVSGGNSGSGTVNPIGLYTAPSQAGTHTVTATSMADTTKTANATVTVTGAAVTVSISPTSATILTGATQQFAATVQGTSNTAVTWSVDNVSGGNSASGTVNANGLYTAPSQAGTHTVTATSVADATKNASAAVTVTVAAVVTVSISPTSATILTGAIQQFAATVQGTSNTAVTWSVDSVSGGNSGSGTVNASGLYTAPSQAGSHTVTATSVADTSKSANANVTVNVNTGLTVIPAEATVAPSGTQQFTASGSATWSVDGVAGGNSSTGTISAGGMYKAPFAIGAHTITATSTANSSLTGTSTLTVINSSPGAVLTYHNDDTRQGAFTEETVLTPANVKAATFGKLFAYPVDGQIYAQPLYLPQVNIGGTNHEVVYVATEHDTVYAFDAKVFQPLLWSKSLGTPVPKFDTEGVSPELGITSTPVIDITTGTIYVLAEATGYTVGPFKLHALDIATGAEKFGGPVYVWGSVTGTGLDSVNGTITLESSCYQRMGLALNPVNNTIEVAFGHCNHGWVLSYNKTTLQQTAIFNTTPNGGGGALWGGGGAPVIDDLTGETYVITGTDINDYGDYNDAFLRLSANTLTVMDFFEPYNNFSLLIPNDADLGSGSNILMPDNSSSTPHETIGGGKDGNIFVVNRDDMGAFSTTSNNVIQTLQTGVKQFDNIFSTPAFWNGSLYYHCEDDVLRAFNWSGGKLSTGAKGAKVFQVHGATTSISANGNTNGIVWEIDNTNIGTGPAVLHASDATNVAATELYNSSQSGSRDAAGTALKFTVPTIAGGEVFVPTANELDIFGLL